MQTGLCPLQPLRTLCVWPKSGGSKRERKAEQIRTTLSTSIDCRESPLPPVRSEALFRCFPRQCVCGLGEMTAGKGASSLMAFLPKALRPQSSDIGGGVLWGTAAITGALFLIQPFDWIKEQLNPPKEEKK